MHGTDAYRDAIEQTLAVARAGADEIRSRPYVELLDEPELSVLIFRRTGWDGRRLRRLERAACWRRATRSSRRPRTTARPCTRMAIVNPRTTVSDIAGILATMA